MPRAPKRTRLLWSLLVTAGLLALAVWAVHRWARQALEIVAERAAHQRYEVAFSDVDITLFPQGIRIDGLRIKPGAAALADGSSTVAVSASRVELDDVDLLALIRSKELKVGTVRIVAPEVDHAHGTRAMHRPEAKDTTDAAQLPEKLAFLRVDTLLIINAKGSTRDLSGVHPNASVAGLDIRLTGIRMAPGQEGRPSVHLSSGELAIRDAEARMAPFYTAHIDSARARYPQNTMRIHGFKLTADVGPDRYHQVKDAPRELYGVRVDSIRVDGSDLGARLEHGMVTAHECIVSGLRLDIHHDRSVPDRHRPRSPLPAERIHHARVPIDIGKVQVRDGRVTYHERLKQGDAYGSVSFTGINVVMAGLGNMRADSVTDLLVTGRLRLWDAAPTEVEVRQSHATAGARISARVHLRDLPAPRMDRLTGELIKVSATEGRIHSVDMHMEGNDVSAKGTVHMNYEGLKLKLEPTMRHAKILSAVANVVVHNNNIPGHRNYRTGEARVMRKQEASVFNYLWTVLREGMLDILLPDMVLNRIHRQRERLHHEHAMEAAKAAKRSK